MTATFARRLWAVRQALFPSFEAKAYHLQFRHGALITMMLMCASFTLPANPQLKEFALSDYFSIPSINTVDSYNQIRKPIFGVMYYNIAVAAFIALHLVIEPQFQRGAPVWFELFWMSAFTIGEIVCLAVFASINPSVCNFHFGIDTTQTFNMKFSPKNSATSICSNWRGMTGLLAAIIGVFLLHITWHVVVSIRHLGARRGVFVLPITDYRWTLPKQLERVNQTFPADIEASPQSDQDKLAIDTQDYTFKSSGFGTTTDRSATVGETLSFPVTTESADYNNYGRPAAKQSSMDALPAKPTQAVVLERSTHSDTESLGESSPTERPAEAPFSNYGRRI